MLNSLKVSNYLVTSLGSFLVGLFTSDRLGVIPRQYVTYDTLICTLKQIVSDVALSYVAVANANDNVPIAADHLLLASMGSGLLARVDVFASSIEPSHKAVMSATATEKGKSDSDSIFEFLKKIRDIDFAMLLTHLLNAKSVGIGDLHQLLSEKGYDIERESLYRYFNSTKGTNRLPPQRFIASLAQCLALNREQEELLTLYWSIAKFLRKRKR